MNREENGLHCRIGLGELDWKDDRFAIHSHRPVEALDWSLQRFGMLQLPWLWHCQGGKPVIVDGFKRLQRLREAGAETVRALAFPPTVQESQVWLQRIAGKLCGPPLNVAEKAQVVARLAQLDCPEADRRDLLRLLQVAPKAEMVAQWTRLAGCETALLEAAATELICDRAALTLADWDDPDRREALGLLQELRCSASIQVQILEQVTEIAMGGVETLSRVLQDAALREILERSDWNHRQKTQAVREFLVRRRFPRLRKREEQFARDLEAAALPATVKLVPPAAFEGMRWQLQITFSHPDELPLLLERAGTFAVSPHLPKLIYGSSPEAEKDS